MIGKETTCRGTAYTKKLFAEQEIKGNRHPIETQLQGFRLQYDHPHGKYIIATNELDDTQLGLLEMLTTYKSQSITPKIHPMPGLYVHTAPQTSSQSRSAYPVVAHRQ